MNTLMLILSLVWVITFVIYNKLVVKDGKTYKNNATKVLATVVAPIVILFFAIYTTASWVVSFKTRDAILANPMVLVEASERLQEIEQEKAMEESRQAVKNIKEEDSAHAPVIGNADGKVVIYEFFDYNCGYCKRGNIALTDVLSTEKDVKVILKNLPIFPISQIPAKAVIAAKEQGKSAELHALLFENHLVPEANEKATEQDMNDKIKAIVFGLAEKAGIDVEKLKKDMEAPAVEEELLRTRQLAEKLQIQGTPAFVVGDQLFRGYIDANQMRNAIQQSR